MSNYTSMFTFSSFAKNENELKLQLPNYVSDFACDSEEQDDGFCFTGVLFISAGSENTLLEKLKAHRNNNLFGTTPNFTVVLNDMVYTESDPLPEKLAFLKQ